MMKYNLLVFVSVNNSQPKPILTELCGRAWTLVISLTTDGCCDFGTTLERIAKILGEIPLNKGAWVSGRIQDLIFLKTKTF